MWHGYNFHDPQNKEKVFDQLINLNSLIRVNDQPINNHSLRNVKMKDLCDNKGNFKTWKTFNDENNREVKWLEFNQLIAGIPKHWKFFAKRDGLIDETITKYQISLNQNKVSRMFYRDLQSGGNVARKCCQTWGKKAQFRINTDEMKKLFRDIYCVTGIIRLRDFQFRLLHNKIFCNDVLVHWGKVNSNICQFCQLYKQDILHLLFNCEKVQVIWDAFAVMLVECGIDYNLCPQNVIFNTVIENNASHVVNLLLLIAKQYIFRCKCMGNIPNYNQIKQEWRNHMKIELYNAKINGNIRKIKTKWEPVLTKISR